MEVPLTNRKLTRPTRDGVVVGRGVLSEVLAALSAGFLVVSQPAALSGVRDADVARAGAVLNATSLEREVLERLSAVAPAGSAVVGIGGGVVMDTSKWLAMKRRLPLVLAPSILSADACVTNSVAVREDGRVIYTGFVEAERVVVDVDLIEAAPARLNRAGVGDLLSIHTALWDWEAGERAGRSTVDREVAKRAEAVLRSVERAADAMREVEEGAIETIIDGYARINDLTVACGHALMEEGSEHYLGYLLEHRTGKTFVHGELVTLGVVVMSRLQGNEPVRARSIAERAGVEWRAGELGMSRVELSDALRDLKPYVEENGFPYSVANQLEPDDRIVDELLAEVM